VVLLVLLSLYISLFDLLHHRISHSSIAIFSVALFIKGDFSIYFRSGFTLLILMMLLGLLAGLGGGDVKFLVAIGFFAIPFSELQIFLSYLILAIALLTIFTIAIRSRLKGNIALAPAICASYLAFTLAR